MGYPVGGNVVNIYNSGDIECYSDNFSVDSGIGGIMGRVSSSFERSSKKWV